MLSFTIFLLFFVVFPLIENERREIKTISQIFFFHRMYTAGVCMCVGAKESMREQTNKQMDVYVCMCCVTSFFRFFFVDLFFSPSAPLCVPSSRSYSFQFIFVCVTLPCMCVVSSTTWTLTHTHTRSIRKTKVEMKRIKITWMFKIYSDANQHRYNF